MDRVNGAGHVGNMFVNEDVASSRPPTEVTPDWLNGVQEEILSVIEGAGLAPNRATVNQLLQAIRLLSTGVVGSTRNLTMLVAAASAGANITADEIVVAAALGGTSFRLGGFNKSINLGVVGVGGMDTGAAPASGYVAIYAIYNPSTKAAALLATNATSAAQPEVYGGAHMPAGFTASALVSVWPTNSSGQFAVGYQSGRKVSIVGAQVLSTSTQQVALTPLSIAGAVPKNAKMVGGFVGVSSTAVGSGSMSVATTASVGQLLANVSVGQATTSYSSPFADLQIATVQTIYYTMSVNSGTMTGIVYISDYTF
ncbi:hypothetical protein [Rhodoferax sp. BLA1]|uniref:hypothetical protein n=1 Tax=Rhodoferax sp. BLA1 TaxID=2576062 RepID=UPI0021051DB5|nr:hypothetical protein [Rhodoferax sp. BLA1]